MRRTPAQAYNAYRLQAQWQAMYRLRRVDLTWAQLYDQQSLQAKAQDATFPGLPSSSRWFSQSLSSSLALRLSFITTATTFANQAGF
jgi:hypothetical protein